MEENMIYIFTLFSTLFFSFFIQRNRISEACYKKNNYLIKVQLTNCIFVFFSGLIPTLISATRVGIGTDYYQYEKLFHSIKYGGYDNSFEPLFFLLNRIILIFTDNSIWLFVICSILFVYLVLINIYKQSENIPFSSCLFFLSYVFFTSLNNIRQSLSSVIVLFALYEIKRGKNLRSVILIVIAALFHKSAIISLSFFFFVNININFLIMLFILVGLIVSRNYWEPIINLGINFLGYSDYLTSDYLAQYIGNNISRSLILLNIIVAMIFLYIELGCVNPDLKESDWNFSKWNQFIILMICIFSQYIPASYRLVNFFTVFQIITVPNSLNGIKNSKRRWLLILVLLLSYLLVTLNRFFVNEEGIVQYQSIFSKFI